jgi:hypothetical protein
MCAADYRERRTDPGPRAETERDLDTFDRGVGLARPPSEGAADVPRTRETRVQCQRTMTYAIMASMPSPRLASAAAALASVIDGPGSDFTRGAISLLPSLEAARNASPAGEVCAPARAESWRGSPSRSECEGERIAVGVDCLAKQPLKRGGFVVGQVEGHDITDMG